MRQIDWSECPEHMRHSLKFFYETGYGAFGPGGFLEAVLSNDLFGAMGRADSESRRILYDLVCFIYNKLPSACYGNREIVHAWEGAEKTFGSG